MKKNIIVQFVCFITNLDFEEFSAKWEHFIGEMMPNPTDMILQEEIPIKHKNKYNYISQHECKMADFRFAFMKGKSPEYFPGHTAKVVRLGGYLPVQIQCQRNQLKDDVKVMAFINHMDADFNFYRGQTYRHLNIYEAYYENCVYNYVLEFFVNTQDAPALIQELKTKAGTEVALYRECAVVHS